MSQEVLLGGPLDGLVVWVDGDTWAPSQAVLREHRNATRARYYRKADGRLHYEFSNWELGGWR